MIPLGVVYGFCFDSNQNPNPEEAPHLHGAVGAEANPVNAAGFPPEGAVAKLKVSWRKR